MEVRMDDALSMHVFVMCDVCEGQSCERDKDKSSAERPLASAQTANWKAASRH